MTTARHDHRAPESLWRLTGPVLVWLAHFLAIYLTAALACGRWRIADAMPLPLSLLYTVAAFGGLAVCLKLGARARPVWAPGRDLDDDAPQARAAFVATTNALLVLAAGIGVLAVGATAMLVPRCR